MAGDELLSTSEVAERLGYKRQRVHQFRHEFDDFPEPVIQHPRALFFSARAIKRWAKAHGYEWSEK